MEKPLLGDQEFGRGRSDSGSSTESRSSTYADHTPAKTLFCKRLDTPVVLVATLFSIAAGVLGQRVHWSQDKQKIGAIGFSFALMGAAFFLSWRAARSEKSGKSEALCAYSLCVGKRLLILGLALGAASGICALLGGPGYIGSWVADQLTPKMANCFMTLGTTMLAGYFATFVTGCAIDSGLCCPQSAFAVESHRLPGSRPSSSSHSMRSSL